ncbi:spinster family MFS transporter [Flavisphingomonas formosensis]|uniref:spinster family MFS transporter n=1 Tax=Flavisphingomonas formosensis TaxID=861534 RepID=UPI0012F73A5B|nr:MFS transporter [Sphingomonas formosensis]
MRQLAGRSRGYALAILTLVYLVNFIDRQIMPVLLPQIKAEFGVSDSALGLLIGPTFAFFYAVLGVPMAMIADRVNRRTLIGASLLLFSAMTALCGAAAQFWQLALARMGTGIGEAGTGPASQAMIADLYPVAERGRAQAIYATGVNLGLLVAFALGGLVAERFGWRLAFLLAGVPGVLLAMLLFATLRDPPRGQSETLSDTGTAPPLGRVLRSLWASKAFRLTTFGACTTCFTGYAEVAFFPSFLERSHVMSPSEIGLLVALIAGIGGGAATFASGYFADRFARRDVRWNLYVPAIAAFLQLPLAAACFFSDRLWLVILSSIPILALTAAFIGPTIVVVQRLVPLRMRATAVAVLILIDNLIGLGLGPQFVGIVSDSLRPNLGTDSLRVAMFLAMGGSAVSVAGFLWAARHVAAEIGG